MRKNAPLLIIALAGVALGALLGNWQRSANQEPSVPVAIDAIPAATTLPAFDFPSPDGELLQSATWNGKVRVVNFWATWCPPCRDEMPLFIELQQEFADQDVQFLGIAMDEAEPTKAFAEEFAINFPILLGDEKAQQLSRQLGNRYGGLPFTVIVDQQGQVVAQHTGELSEARLRPLLEQLTRANVKL